jgi:hypothetical protein
MNIRDLMARIDTLQEYDEPMVEEYTPIQTTNTLLAAMLELREDGIIESVDPHAIFNQVKEIHREFRDIEEGDLPDRIYWFDKYKTSQIPLSQINLNEFEVDEDLVEDYIEYIKDSPKTMPPIVYDPVAGSVIDGMHRANAYARLGYDTIPAYVGLTKSSSYGESSEPVDEAVEKPVVEASPNTLEGSFTPDLVESKTWLAEMLAKGLKGKNAGTIYVLGSWYGNMGIFLQQAGVKFDKLVLIEPNEKWLMHSKELLDTLNDEGKLVLIHQKAEDAVYEKPGVVINTSCNETGPVFLTKLPDNMLCLLQARNNNENTLFPTEDEEDFIDYFPLEKVYYTGKKQLEDPEVNYVRYMKIGRTGKKNIDEGPDGDHQTGGALGLPFPGTYEQEYSNFKRHGQRRMGTLTTEALDSSYEYHDSKQNPGNDFYFDTEDGQEYKVEIDNIDNDVTVAFSARGQGDEHKTGITGTGNSRKIFGTVIKIVKDYISKSNPEIIAFSANNSEPSRVRLYKMLASQANKELPNYNFTDAFSNGGLTTYYLTRDGAKIPTSTKVKAKAGKALDAVFEGDS